MMDPMREQAQTIADALLAEHDIPQDAVPHAPPPGAAPVEYPRVIVNNRPLREITAEIVQVLQTTNTPPVLFLQAERLVRLRQDERGQAWFEPVTDLHLHRRLTQVADVVHVSGDQAEHAWHVCPSLTLLRDVLAMAHWPFPPVESLARPTLRRP